ncbi:hypothetical protein V4C53_36080 [Paraburkholderia azotifigens]|uniref:hypothetical protein n=1 Tax=Paraburkholderia azotifigens TaxID=2057004 RepID=UPI003170F0B6
MPDADPGTARRNLRKVRRQDLHAGYDLRHAAEFDEITSKMMQLKLRNSQSRLTVEAIVAIRGGTDHRVRPDCGAALLEEIDIAVRAACATL